MTPDRGPQDQDQDQTDIAPAPATDGVRWKSAWPDTDSGIGNLPSESPLPVESGQEIPTDSQVEPGEASPEADLSESASDSIADAVLPSHAHGVGSGTPTVSLELEEDLPARDERATTARDSAAEADGRAAIQPTDAEPAIDSAGSTRRNEPTPAEDTPRGAASGRPADAPIGAHAGGSKSGATDYALLRQIAPVVGIAALVWLFVSLAPVLEPFVAAMVLAYICNPLVERLEARGLPRVAGATLTTLLLILGFLAFLLVVAPLFIEQSARLADRVPTLLRGLADEGLPWLNDRLGSTISLDLATLSDLARQHAESLRSGAAKAFVALSQRGAEIAGVFGLMLLVPVVTCYLLIDFPRLSFSTKMLAPKRWQATISAIGGEIDHVLGEFLRGQLAVMLALAAFYSTALAIAGIEYALALGLITGLLCFIPYVGFGLGLTLALLSAFLQNQGWPPFLWVAAIFAAGQLVESFVLTPRLVGERIGLHPVAVIFALLVFGQLLGFTGVVIALPVSAVLLVALRHALANYRRSDFFTRP